VIQSAAAGLPAYTMPPVSPQPPTGGVPAGGAPTYERRQHAQSEQKSDQTMVGNPTPSWNQPSGSPYGVGSPGAVRQPFGGPAAQVSTPPAQYTTYGPSSSGLPQQRGEGTVYGAQSPADMTMPVTMNAIENSGSLTGHILAQGWDRGVDTGRRSNVKVGIAMLVVLLFLVGVSLLFLFTAGDAFTDMVNGVFNKE
jgi:hypothetical protein